MAVVFSMLYLLSDAIEFGQGGFSAGQLWLTLAAEAAIPVFVVGLTMHAGGIGRLGQLSGWAYASCYLVFTGTVVYALVDDTPNYAVLTDELGALMLATGAVMVLAGLGFGLALLRARSLPAWTAIALMAGVVFVAAAQALPEAVQLAAAGVRDLGFAGMGAALLRASQHAEAPASRAGELDRNTGQNTTEAAREPARSASATVPPVASVDLIWLPLGAGGRVVRLNGRAYEALSAWHEHRPRCELYHAALEVQVPAGRFVIELAPAWGAPAANRGVVLQGPVGVSWAGNSRLFRYELRSWRDGLIPDLAAAVDSPQQLSRDLPTALRLLSFVPDVPALTWGRDQLGAGDMWNSNSVVAWLLARSGLNAETIVPPRGGRAPGWRAGVVAASLNPSDPRHHGRLGRSAEHSAPEVHLTAPAR
jgi:hypothetical protein